VEVPEAAAIDDESLERIAALGWRGLDEAPLGGWLLRAGGGFTGRANSVLPLGSPGRPVADALSEVRAWYAARGLPALIQLPLPLQAELHAEVLALGWVEAHDAEVLVADVSAVLAEDFRVTSDLIRVDDRPDHEWLALYHYRGGELPAGAVEVMTKGDTVGFASIVRDGAVVAIGRGAVAEGWVGLTAIEVATAVRRQGLGALVVRALLAWGDAGGARSTYLQVSPDNSPALALYASLGYVHHHRYVYLAAPP
jgi:GNAT superfamily N-acetyltransferase